MRTEAVLPRMTAVRAATAQATGRAPAVRATPRAPAAWAPAATARAALLALAGLALCAGAAALSAPAPAVDPDLVRVIRCMALIKGAFALAALGAAYWRLGRPAASWRRAVYVAAPAPMIAGALALWSLHAAGAAAVGLHLGLLAALAAALTDPDFLPDRLRARRGP